MQINYFADIAPMILSTMTNAVLNITDVDKAARTVHLTKIAPELDQNQQIQSEIYLHKKNIHLQEYEFYLSMATNPLNLATKNRQKTSIATKNRLLNFTNFSSAVENIHICSDDLMTSSIRSRPENITNLVANVIFKLPNVFLMESWNIGTAHTHQRLIGGTSQSFTDIKVF